MCPAWFRAPFIFGCYHSQHEGDKSGCKSSGFGFVRLVFVGVSLGNHWRLESYSFCPRPLLVTPLSTTFVHILRLNRLLSTRKFVVDVPNRDSPSGARNVGVNQPDDH